MDIKYDKLITVEVSGDEDETFEVYYEYNPYCVWLICSKRKFPMPIGNMIYPYNYATIVGREGKQLTLKLTNISP